MYGSYLSSSSTFRNYAVELNTEEGEKDDQRCGTASVQGRAMIK